MPISRLGFSAVLVPSPTITTPQPLNELKISQSSNIIECYIEATPFLKFRIYFTRSIPVIEELECYLAVILTEGGTPACKVYAVGKGVSKIGNSTWFLSGQLGEEVLDLNLTINKYVELKLMRAIIKDGVVLGNGELLVSDLERIEDDAFVTFRWFWLTKEQILQMGLNSTDSTDNATINPNLSSENPIPPQASNQILNDFLRTTNEILLSLLTPPQQILFLSEMINSSSTSKYLTLEEKNKFEQSRRKILYTIEEEEKKKLELLELISISSTSTSNLNANILTESIQNNNNLVQEIKRFNSKSPLKENNLNSTSLTSRSYSTNTNLSLGENGKEINSNSLFSNSPIRSTSITSTSQALSRSNSTSPRKRSGL